MSSPVPPRATNFGCPYRFGHLNSQNNDTAKDWRRGCVKTEQRPTRLSWEQPHGRSAGCGTKDLLTEFLLGTLHGIHPEHRHRRRLFRIWHPPCFQSPYRPPVSADDLMAATGKWWLGRAQVDWKLIFFFFFFFLFTRRQRMRGRPHRDPGIRRAGRIEYVNDRPKASRKWPRRIEPWSPPSGV